MRLVHKFTLKPNNETAIILGTLTYASARLFNAGNYERIEYKKLGFEKAPDWYDQKRRLKDNMWFKSLPAQTAQDVLKRVDKDNDMGHINNQKFHALPFRMIYQKLAYKLKLNGIKLYYQQEAYTSSCLIDSIDVSKEYQTKSRIKRGLCYDKEKNTIYNADCVGAFNIMRLFKKNNNLSFEMNVKGLSSPEKHVSV